MRKFLAVYLATAMVLLGGLSAIGQTLDLKSVSQLTRIKQMAKQDKVEYITETLASAPVQEALQKAGVKLSPKDAEILAKFAPAKKLDLLYSQCESVNQAMALGQYGSAGGGMGTMWLIIGLASLVILVVLLLVLLDTDDLYDPYYYYWS